MIPFLHFSFDFTSHPASRKLSYQSSDSPLFCTPIFHPYILAGRGNNVSLSLFSSMPPTRSLDIPFTFCPGLPLVASGQFEHFSLALFIIRLELGSLVVVVGVVVVPRSPTFTNHYSRRPGSSCHCLSRVHTRRRARTCTHTHAYIHISSHSIFLATTRYRITRAFLPERTVFPSTRDD